MANSFWTEVEDAYARIVQMSQEGRVSFLNENYGDRPDVRQEIQSLLKYQPAADRLSQLTALDAAAHMFADADEDLIGTVVAGRYIIRRHLGEGNMGEVYLADHIMLDMPFALKRPAPSLKSDPEYRERLIGEARRAVILRHDNIARVHDVAESDQDIFVVMEYIEGETLRTRLRTLNRPFSTAEFLPIAIECASALAIAHGRRIVHLDVKPENIMLTTTGHVKICDFGIARKLSTGGDPISTSDDWTFAGTPAYMAPEVIVSHQFDERADQFSLGIVFYEMLTGKNPFLAETVVATTGRVMTEHPPQIREINAAVDLRVERIVMRLLSKEPEQRYSTTSELVDHLVAIHRSEHRLRELITEILETIAEYASRKTAAAILLLVLSAAVPAWVYRAQITQWLGFPRLPEKKIVVVLPFRAIGDTVPQPYSAGLSETVTASLSHVAVAPGIEVIPISALRDNVITTAEEGRRKFAANLAIDGSIQAVNGEYRVNLALVDTKELKQVRRAYFTIPKLDSLAVQNRITEAVIAFLEIELGTAQQSFLSAQTTRNPEAYGAYLNGVGYLSNRDVEGIESAIKSFHEAIAVDSNFSLAYAGLGQAFRARYRIELKDPQPSLVERAREACNMAVALNTNLAAGHVCLGSIYNDTGEYQRAVEEFEKALALEPRSDETFLGLAWSHERSNNWEAAEGAYQKAITVRPSYWFNYQMLAQFYLFSRLQHNDAIKEYRAAIDRAPENVEPYMGLCAAYILSGQYAEAVQTCNRAIGIEDDASSYINLGVAYWGLRNYPLAAQCFEHAVQLNPGYYKAVGHLARAYSWIPEKRGQAQELYRKAIELAGKELEINPREPNVNVMVARYHAMLGQRALAMSHLNRALALRPKDAEFQEIAAVIHNQFGETTLAINYLETAIAQGYSLDEIINERELDNLREDPRFRALMTTKSKKEKGNG